MKMIEFIKRNISVFLISGGFFLQLSFIIFISSFNESDYHGYARGFSIIFLLSGLFLFVLDFIFKKLIKSKFNLNFLEIVLLVTILIYFFKIFIQ